jgi:hypothetical protein
MLLSLDVGIRNLAYCIMDKDCNIVDWKSLDIGISKNDNKCIECNQNAKYLSKNVPYCLKHVKEFPTFCEGLTLTSTNFSKLKLEKLKDLEAKIIEISKAITVNRTKDDKISFLQKHYQEFCFLSLKAKSADISLIEIGKNIKHLFDEHLQQDVEISEVLIENQIGPLAIRMKCIQGMLAQYFIMKNEDIKIHFVSSSNKLKGHGKMTYSERKKKSIELCKEMLKETDMMQMFSQSSKKDDLADCLLQAVWYLQKK